MFAFFTPQQVDDHLFAVQPPQCSEMSGSNKQKHRENNITKYIHLTWKSFAFQDLKMLNCLWWQRESLQHDVIQFIVLVQRCGLTYFQPMLSGAFARQLPAVNRNYRSLGFRDDYGLAGHFHPLQSNCFHQHPAISMFSLKNLKNFSPSWPGHHRPITFARKGVGEKPAKNPKTH